VVNQVLWGGGGGVLTIMVEKFHKEKTWGSAGPLHRKSEYYALKKKPTKLKNPTGKEKTKDGGSDVRLHGFEG